MTAAHGWAPPEPTNVRRAALVGLGGAAGAAARWCVNEALGAPHLRGLPWAVLAVNLVGSAVLAWAVLEARRRPARASILVDGLGTGFCGGLTTFSAFAVATAAQLRGGEPVWAVATVATMLLGGVGGALAVRRAHVRRPDLHDGVPA